MASKNMPAPIRTRGGGWGLPNGRRSSLSPAVRPDAGACCAMTLLSSSVDDRGLHHRPEAVAKLDPVGIAHLHHVDGDELLLGIDPEQGAGVACPTILA